MNWLIESLETNFLFIPEEQAPILNLYLLKESCSKLLAIVRRGYQCALCFSIPSNAVTYKRGKKKRGENGHGHTYLEDRQHLKSLQSRPQEISNIEDRQHLKSLQARPQEIPDSSKLSRDRTTLRDCLFKPHPPIKTILL